MEGLWTLLVKALGFEADVLLSSTRVLKAQPHLLSGGGKRVNRHLIYGTSRTQDPSDPFRYTWKVKEQHYRA